MTYHDSCHLLRELGVEEGPRKLLRKVRGIDLVEMQDYQLCCGFGGTFSAKFPEVSVPMGQDKVRAASEAGAEYLVAADGGCLMHLAGLIHRQRLPLKTLHLAEVLAQQEKVLATAFHRRLWQEEVAPITMDDTGIHSNEIHAGASRTLGNARLLEAYRASTLRLYTHRLQAISEVLASSGSATGRGR